MLECSAPRSRSSRPPRSWAWALRAEVRVVLVAQGETPYDEIATLRIGPASATDPAGRRAGAAAGGGAEGGVKGEGAGVPVTGGITRRMRALVPSALDMRQRGRVTPVCPNDPFGRFGKRRPYAGCHQRADEGYCQRGPRGGVPVRTPASVSRSKNAPAATPRRLIVAIELVRSTTRSERRGFSGGSGVSYSKVTGSIGVTRLIAGMRGGVAGVVRSAFRVAVPVPVVGGLSASSSPSSRPGRRRGRPSATAAPGGSATLANAQNLEVHPLGVLEVLLAVVRRRVPVEDLHRERVDRHRLERHARRVLATSNALAISGSASTSFTICTACSIFAGRDRQRTVRRM